MLLLVVCGVIILIDTAAYATTPYDEYEAKQLNEFNKYKGRKKQKFSEYRRKRNEDYAQYLSKRWKNLLPEPEIPKPKDETIPPVIIEEDNQQPILSPNPIPYDEVIPVPKPDPQPTPIEPIEEIVEPSPVAPQPKMCEFTFFGTNANVRYDNSKRFTLSQSNEKGVADAWLKLSGDDYTNLVYDCLEIRKKKKLDDWAYLMMVKNMAESIFGKNSNESILLTAFVYCQSGYKIRLAFDEKSKLEMLFASKHTIYEWPYYTLDKGEMFYPMNKGSKNLRICEQQYPKEQSMSLVNINVPVFTNQPTSSSSHQSTRDKAMKVTMTANKNRLDFYSSYPTSMMGDNFVSRWALYANMPMPKDIKEQVYPQLKEGIKGCDQLTALNKILNWVQTGFEYEYDDKVWGGDRAFFPEESLHYPYCDCEDRSILLTRIVRDILGLECILIYYPGHLAAAVAVTEGNPTGDYISLNGKRFFITDGTIMGYGAPVGATMKGMDNKTAKVILLK